MALPVWRHVKGTTPVEETGERTTLGAGKEAQGSLTLSRDSPNLGNSQLRKGRVPL